MREIGLSFNDFTITKVGLTELLEKCPKLVEIASDENKIPKEIRHQLNKRKNITNDDDSDDSYDDSSDDDDDDEEEGDDDDSYDDDDDDDDDSEDDEEEYNEINLY